MQCLAAKVAVAQQRPHALVPGAGVAP
jgi:hypothetical protein